MEVCLATGFPSNFAHNVEVDPPWILIYGDLLAAKPG